MSRVALEIAALVALLAASAFFSGSEAAFFSLHPWQVPQDESTGRRGRAVRRLLERPASLLVALLLGNECVNVTLSFISSDMRSRFLPGVWGAALGVALTTALIVLLGDAVPKAISATHPAAAASAYAPLLSPYLRVVRWPAERVLDLVVRLRGRPPEPHDAVEELQHLIRAARTEGSFLREEEKALARIVAFERDPVSSAMVPRTALRQLSVDASREEALAQASFGQWILVHGESPEDVLGVASPQAILQWSLAPSPRELATAVVPVPLYPETRLLRLVFADLFEQDHPAVILMDEYGAVAGLMTREHLAAHVLLAEPDALPTTAGEALPGALPYAHFRELFPAAPEDTRCKTLAGHVLNLAGSVPFPGDVFDDGAFRYTVAEVTARQILAIRVEPMPARKA